MTPGQLRIKAWREDPSLFVRDNFKVEPDVWQLEVLAAFASTDPNKMRISMQACAGPGKSAVLAWCGWNFLSCYGEPGHHPKAAVMSITSDNLKDGLWAELSKWQSESEFLSKAFKWTKERIFAIDHPETWFMSARSFPKTANAEEQGRTLSGLHSKYILYLLDESGDISPNVLKSAEQGLSTGPIFGKILQAGNPTSLDGMLYAAATILREQWFVVVITGDPEDPRRSKRIDPIWAAEQIKAYGRDNPWVKSFILGQFPPSSINALFSIDDVQAAMQREHREEVYNWSQKRIGVDVARFGDDVTCLFPRQGLQSFTPVIMRNANTTEITNRILMAKAKWGSEVEFIDGTGGYGAGVVDQLRLSGHSPMEIHFSAKASSEKYLNKRAEMWFEMNEWVKRGGALPNDARLAKELVSPTYTFSNGKFQLEPKDQIKKRLGFSPDCFTAGTMIRTPDGPRPIESIREGDLVSTPMGDRTVIKAWESKTDELTTVRFSNGSMLIGKGAHKVFTWTRGAIRLDGLSLDDAIESDHRWQRLKWSILSLLFTKAKSLGFKQLVDTISLTGLGLAYKDFYTVGFGSIIMAQYLRVCTSITLMATGLTTQLRILSLLSREPTCESICTREWLTQPIEPKHWPRSIKPRKPRLNGISPRLALPGISNTAKQLGIVGGRLKFLAQFVGLKSSHIFHLELDSVQSRALKRKDTNAPRPALEIALCAAKSLFTTAIESKSVVPESVQTDTGKSVSVYNLTLDDDNVYYANGILVFNCADALALSFAHPDQPASDSIQAVIRRSKQESENGDWDPFDSSRI